MHKARHVIKSIRAVFYLIVPFTSRPPMSLKHFLYYIRREIFGRKDFERYLVRGVVCPQVDNCSAIKHCKHNLCLEFDYSYDLFRNKPILNLKFHSEKQLNFKHSPS